MNTSDVLEGAADLIEKRGLYQAGMDAPVWPGEGVNGELCAIRACVRANHCVIKVQHVLTILQRTVGYPLPIWSDNSTKEEVIAMLRAVAMSERAAERAREASPVRVVAETQDALPESVRS